VKRTLITTADERTWPTISDPILFLGQWCRRYSRKDMWESLDAKVVPYHWDDRNKLQADYISLSKLYEQLLLELAEKLNKLHDTNHTIRYWRILIGPWLGYFVQMLFDRWFMVKYAIENYSISRAFIIKREPFSSVPNDMADFARLFIKDEWNEGLYTEIMYRFCDKIDLVEIKNEDRKTHDRENIKSFLPLLVKGSIEKVLQLYNSLFSKDDKYFFHSTYLPIKENLSLQLRLGSIPKIWRNNSSLLLRVKINKSARDWILGSNKNSDSDFLSIVRSLIPKHIPVAYLEGYKQLQLRSDKLSWPLSPSVIFTSNAYYANDVFKVYSAGKIEKGTKLVIGQHGGHYGMTPFSYNEEHQIKIADKWFSWGWSNPNFQQILPIGNFKEVNRSINYNPKGNALMVEMTMPRYSYHLYAVPVSSQWINYFSDQLRFLKSLPKELREIVRLRLFPQDFGWDQIERWNQSELEVKFENSKKNIKKIIKKYRLYIATYNATTYLESLFWNFPTIIFWNPNHWELNKNTKPYFELLAKVGIFHETPESAADHMAKVWDNINNWWLSESVQAAREQFCNEYSKRSDQTYNNLSNALNSSADQCRS
jgi:putative transferase (TIGR04331 family)